MCFSYEPKSYMFCTHDTAPGYEASLGYELLVKLIYTEYQERDGEREGGRVQLLTGGTGVMLRSCSSFCSMPWI